VDITTRSVDLTTVGLERVVATVSVSVVVQLAVITPVTATAAASDQSLAKRAGLMYRSSRPST
jgi:hypothetical protein